MGLSHWRRALGQALVAPVVVAALFLAAPLTGQQKKGGQKYLDRWVYVPFCGSVTITRNGGGEGTLGDFSIKESEFGQLTANIAGSKDVISPRTGRAHSFFLEGTVNTTLNFQEIRTASNGMRFVWNLDATGQKRHSYEGKAYKWTALYVNRARGLYRFDPPRGSAKGTLIKSTPAGTQSSQESIDAWWEVAGEVHNVERSFDPEKGTISGFASFNWSKPLMNDFGSGFNIDFKRDHLTYRPSEEEVAPKEEERAAELLTEALPTGPVTFQVSWNLNLDTGACQRKVRILAPKEDDEVVFGQQHSEPKNLVFNCLAEANPKSYEPNIYPWAVDDIGGSTKVLKSLGLNCQRELDVTPVKGPCVRFRFKDMPKDNAQFGKKTITADTSEPLRVKVLFKKFAKANPEGKDPNWFYYWKQGAVPGLEKFKYVDPPPSDCSDCFGQFAPPNALLIFEKAALCQDATTIELFERLPGFMNPYEGMGYRRGGVSDGGPVDNADRITALKEFGSIVVFRTLDIEELKGVDFCHSVVLHELNHKWVYDTFHAYTDTGAMKDSDGDWLPDDWEIWTKSRYQFDPNDSDTHFMRYQWSEDYDWDGDLEVLAFEAEMNHAALHELDWATPGKQSQDKDECNVQH